MDWVSERQVQCHRILMKLLSSPAHRFDDDLAGALPLAPGLYAISRLPGEEFLHAGRTKTGLNGLRGRAWVQHFQTGGSGGDLIEKVKLDLKDEGQVGTPKEAKDWIRRNCQVRWVVVEDPALRKWSEHYILSILRPIWGH